MKSKVTPIVVSVLIPLISIAVAVSLIYFKKNNFSGLEEFPYAAYIKNPENSSGNKYQMNAQMDLQLANLGKQGRVVSVIEASSGARLAVLIPEDISENIVTRQRYKMQVEIGKGGKITVLSMEKY